VFEYKGVAGVQHLSALTDIEVCLQLHPHDLRVLLNESDYLQQQGLQLAFQFSELVSVGVFQQLVDVRLGRCRQAGFLAPVLLPVPVLLRLFLDALGLLEVDVALGLPGLDGTLDGEAAVCMRLQQSH